MLLTKLKLNYFGRFQQKEIELKPGINLIFGENESGKSTVHAFIKGMLFGIERLRGRASASKEDLYTRYLPWDYPGAFGGSMDLEIGGNTYRLTRSFHANDKSFLILNLATGREVKLREGLISELIPGLSEAAFRNTVSIEQLKAQTDSELALQVRNYIANLSVAKSKEINVAKAVSFLNEQRKHLESLHNTAQLNELRSEIEEGIAKEERMDQLTLQLQKLLEQEQGLQKQREELAAASDQEAVRRMEQLPAILEKYRSYRELDNQIRRLEFTREEFEKRMEEGKGRQQALEQIKEDKRAAQFLDNEIKELDRQASELDRKQEELELGNRKGLYYCVLPAAIAAILAVVLTGFEVAGLFLAAGVLLAGAVGYYFLNRKNKSVSGELHNKKDELWSRKTEAQKEFQDILGRNRAEHAEGLNDRQEELLRGIYNAENAKEQLEDIRRRRIDAVDSMDTVYDSIMKYVRYYIPAEELTENIMQRLTEELRLRKQESSRRWDRLNEDEKEYRLQIEKLRWEISKLEGNEEELLRNQEKFQQLIQQQSADTVELEAIKLALSSIQELSAEIHDSFGNQLNQAVSEVIRRVTGERYQELKIDEKLGVKVGWKGDYVLLERLSAGTIDQIYLAMRLAVADLLLGRDEAPLLLDDSFAFYDDKRVKAALAEVAGRRQLLLFTCHRREQELLEELELPYHLIDLSCDS
jgi:DNA repair exonuclease SbcCD ATPase subunit